MNELAYDWNLTLKFGMNETELRFNQSEHLSESNQLQVYVGVNEASCENKKA